jgi:hypothetical protein
VQNLEDALIKAKTLGEIALLYAKTGQKPKADQLLTEALNSVNSIQENYQKSNVRQEIIRN